MKVKINILASSPKNCCRGNASALSLSIVIGVDVTANNIKVFSVAM
jgi:hypothetical protein